MATAKTVISRNRVESPRTKSAEVYLTAEVAEQFLEYNGTNRPASKSLVRFYANQMLRGVWEFNGENLIFALCEEGAEHLHNGQHRLLGLVHAQGLYDADPEAYPNAPVKGGVVGITTVVTYGVEHSAADSIDVGKPRTNADKLFRSDVVVPDEWDTSEAKRKRWCSTLSTAAKVLWQRQGGKTVSSAEKFDSGEMNDLIEANPALSEFVTLVLNADANDDGNKGIKMSLAYVASLGYLSCLDAEGELVEECADRFELFVDHVAIGTGYDKKSAAHAITGYWNSLGPGSKNRDTEVVGPFVKALNVLHSEGSATPAQLKLKKSEWEDRPVLEGWDRACYEEVAEIKVAEQEAKAQAKAEKEAEKQRKAEERAQAKAEKAAAAKEAKAEKAAAKAAAEAEAAEAEEFDEEEYDEEYEEGLDPEDIPEVE